MDILGALGQLYMKVLLILLFVGSGLAVWALIGSFQSKGNNKAQGKVTANSSKGDKSILTNIKFDKKLGGIIMNGNGWFKLAVFSLVGILISTVALGFVSTINGSTMNMNGNQQQQSNMNMGNSNMQGSMNAQGGMNMQGNMPMQGSMNVQGGMNMQGNMPMQSGMSMSGQAPMNSTNSSASIQEQLNSIQNQLNQLQTQMQQQSQMNNTQNQNSNMSNGSSSSGSSSGSMSSGGGMSMM